MLVSEKELYLLKYCVRSRIVKYTDPVCWRTMDVYLEGYGEQPGAYPQSKFLFYWKQQLHGLLNRKCV